MAGFRVGNHFLISRPHYDETLRAWVPYVRVITNLFKYGGAVPEKFKFHVVDGFKETFESEEEAVFFGISKAEAWLQEPPRAVANKSYPFFLTFTGLINTDHHVAAISAIKSYYTQ